MFLTVEGMDGAGKTTLLNHIQSYCMDRHIPYCMTREPGGCPRADQLRSLLLERPTEGAALEWSAASEALLIWAARIEHVRTVIIPALEQNIWVICDRYIDSTMAYQGGGRGLSAQVLEDLEALIARLLGQESFLQPDHTVYLDLSFQESLVRRHARGLCSDRFEQEGASFFDQVRAAYLRRAEREPARVSVIDARQSIQAVFEQVRPLLEKHYASN